MDRPVIIAEIGCNHKGEVETAKEMIRTAKIFCNADAVKFQTRDVETWAVRNPKLYNAPHPNASNAYGRTYKEHRQNLEFSTDQHKELKAYCEEMCIGYSTSVWDIDSAKRMASLEPSFLKVPSACNTDFEMLEWLLGNYGGDVHLSTGMTTKKEINDIVELFSSKGRAKDLVLYSCTSGYPVPFEDVCLLEIEHLRSQYGSALKAIGFSGHHKGIAVDVAAYVLGATYFERHFTLDRTWKGTDHAASLEPDGIRRLVRDLNNVRKTMSYKEKEILDIEQIQRTKLKYCNEVLK